MSTFTKHDQEILAESYQEILDEAFGDRFKAGAAGLLGGIKGAAQKLGGQATQLAGKAVSKAGDYAAQGVEAVGGTIDPSKNKIAQKGQAMQQAGQEKIDTSATAGINAKIDSYKQSANGIIQNALTEITNDLQKLGIQLDPKAMAQFQKSIKGIQTTVTKSLDAFKAAQGTKPAAPAAAPTPTAAPAGRQRSRGKVASNALQNRAAMPEAEEGYY